MNDQDSSGIRRGTQLQKKKKQKAMEEAWLKASLGGEQRQKRKHVVPGHSVSKRTRRQRGEEGKIFLAVGWPGWWQ